MKGQPRLFSLEEANSVLPQLQSLLDRLTQKIELHSRLHDELFIHELALETSPHQGLYDPSGLLENEARQLDEAVAELETDIKKIRSYGCIIRNLQQGWVDFLSRQGEELIYFCWKRGEEKIQYYHPLQSAQSSRIPL